MFVSAATSARLRAALPAFVFRVTDFFYGAWLDFMLPRVSRRLVGELFGGRPLEILGGPFRGMKYREFATGSALVPKLVGSYEAELHPTLEAIFKRGYRKVINIGCAEGYYAVGLASRMPDAVVHAYDLMERARSGCRALAEHNGVASRVLIHGECTPATLQEMCDADTLVVCDCEGAESFLLDPERAPNLRHCDILVELHDRIVPGVTETIRGRFAAGATVEIIPSAERNPRDFPALRPLSLRDQHRAIDELRGGVMHWAMIRARPTQ